MPKKPDLSDLTSKFDLDKILGGIKSMINPAGATPEVDPDDALGLKISQLSTLFQEIAKSHAQLAADFTKANEILNGLFKDLEAVRGSKPKATPTEKPTENVSEKAQAKPHVKSEEKPTEDLSSKPGTPEEENKDTK